MSWDDGRRVELDFDRTIVVQYSSIFDVANRLKVAERHMERHKENREEHDGSIKWYGVENHKAVEKLAVSGWKEGAEQAIQVMDDLDVSDLFLPSRRRKRIRSDTGDSLDMQSVWNGDLDRAWHNTKKIRSRGKSRATVTILCELTAPWYTDSKAFFWRGAATLVLAKALEQSGRRVKIVAYEHSTGVFLETPDNRRDLFATVVCKETYELLDIERIATLLCMGGAFRHYFFKIVESFGDRNFCTSYGTCCGDIPTNIPEVELSDVVVINGIWNKESCSRKINEEIEKFKTPALVS